MEITNSSPFFSVIVPLFNKQEFVEDTINSILAQSFQDFEIIIVNDGSTDNSFDIISKIEDVRIAVIEQKNLGVSVARNNGIDNAQGKFIALLDADDIWHINHLAELKKQILLFPEAGLYCNNYQVYYSKELASPAKLNFKFADKCLIVDDFFKSSIINSVAWTSSVGFSKKKFNSIGGFNKALKTAQDLDLWIRMALNFDVAVIPVITMSYKLYVDNSLSKNEYNELRYEFINSFSKEEQQNDSLKLYLDINRYAVAIRSLINKEYKLYDKLRKEIDCKNLNFKQKILLSCPRFLLKLTKQLHVFLVRNGIYISAFK